ncbi:MAG TPA: chloride channel protein, partial [Bacteroidetes bacterium]|nr:chloride channel protein [Bacteroidota bacterium]
MARLADLNRSPIKTIRRLGREAVRDFSSREYSFNLLIAIIVGVVGGYGAVIFRLAISMVQKGAFGSFDPSFRDLLSLPWYVRFGLPVVGGLIVGPIVSKFASEAKGHGVPEVMEAIALRGGRIRPIVVVIKAMASAFTLGTGGSVGREGPIVQIGAALGSTLGQAFRMSEVRIRT